MTKLKLIRALAFTTLIIILIIDLAPARMIGRNPLRYDPVIDCSKCSHYWHVYDTVHAVKTREETEKIEKWWDG